MSNKLSWVARTLFLYVRINIIYCRHYFPILLLFAVINPLVMLNFKSILKRIEPNFIKVDIVQMFPRPKFYILYVPSNPLLTKMFSGLTYSKEIKTFASTSSSLPMVESWKNLKVFTFSYLSYEIIDFNLLENVSKSSLTPRNVAKMNYHILNMSFSSLVIGKYGHELSLSQDMKSAYLTIIYILKCSLFSMYHGEKMPKVSITGLPNSIFYVIPWHIIQLLFYYSIFGCIVLHLKTIRRLSSESIIPQKGWYTIANYFTIFVLYQIICAIVHATTSLTLCTDLLKSKIMHSIPWYYLMLLFLLNTSTILIFGIVLCELDMTTYNLLYFLSMIIAPQMMFIFAYGTNGGLNCYF